MRGNNVEDVGGQSGLAQPMTYHQRALDEADGDGTNPHGVMRQRSCSLDKFTVSQRNRTNQLQCAVPGSLRVGSTQRGRREIVDVQRLLNMPSAAWQRYYRTG